MKRVSIFILVAGILLAACQKDPASGGESDKGVAVQLRVSSSIGAEWKSGDRVRMFTTASDGSVSFVTLSTTSSGVSAQFSTSATVKTGSNYRFIFPDAKADVVASSTSVFASIPARQTAYAGSADPAACILVGQTDDLKKEISLMPAPAFLKFTLAGDGASEVKKMEITSTDGYILAGDIAWERDNSSSVYTVKHNSVRNREQPSSSITLSGSFEAGKTYYVPVIPGASTTGLTLNLSDAEGRTQTIEIAKTLSLTPSTPCDLNTVTVEEFAGASDFAPRFVYTKEGIKPYVFVFMSDGFTESERDKYTKAAQQAIDHIFSVQPYKGLKEYFSAYVCWTPSETSGVGTRWGTTYSGSGSSAIMASYGQTGRNTIYSYVGERCPEVINKVTSLDNVGIFMLNNNTSYIRPVCDWESSGRFVTPVGLFPNTSSGYSQWCYGGTWRNYDYRSGVRHDLTADELTALGYASNGRRDGDYRDECLHEGAGHGFGRLGDEYWTENNKASSGYTGLDYYHNSTLPTMLNVSANSSNLPWTVLNEMRDELIQKDKRYERIGTYEGAYGYETGIWRAEQVSAMMDNRPYFSTWERALIYMRLMRSSGENASFDPRNKDDLKKYLELDVSFEGIRDPLRDSE